MTIKPAAKRAPPDADNNKIESSNGGGADTSSSHGQQNVVVGRSGVAAGHRSNVVMDTHGQSPQRRELYEDVPRHRCSPNKSGRNKRREHMHDTHHKRERNDRGESHKHSNVSSSSQAASRSHGVNIGVGGLLIPTVNNINLSNNGSVVPSGVAGRNSPAINDVPVNQNHAGLLATGASNIGLANVSSGTKSPSSLDYLGPSSSSNAVVVSQATVSKILNDVEEKCSGYNSGDEYIPSKEKAVTAAEWKRRDEQFVRIMSELGYEVRQVEEDGACLFRAISLQIYGDEDAHDVIRQHTMDYIFKNREYFSHFVTEDIDEYISRKRRKDSHGNHIEIQAMSEIYGRPVEVYCYKPKPINIFNSEQQRNGYAPLRLSYQRWSHYNAIIDPYNATVGVGLGIANYHPQMQTKEASRLSEQLEIEQTMFEDKLKTTDWEATNEVIEEQVARESYLQWCRENMQRNRAVVARSATATITSAQANDTTSISQSCDEIASPSKYANISFNNNASLNLANSVNDGSNMLNPASVSPLSSARKLNFITLGEKQCNAESSAGVTIGGSSAPSTHTTAKKLNVLTKHQKDAANYDSDDTDISTNSSLNELGSTSGGSSGNSIGGVSNSGSGNVSGSSNGPQSPGRSKKMKTRINSKKRRHEHLMRQNDKSEEALSALRGGGGDSPHSGGGGGGGCASADALQRVHKGAKRDTSMSQSSMHAAGPGDSIEERPCSSKCAQQLNIDNAMASDNTTSASFSSFYQDLLESSYTTDGYGQLTEAEMLQRAIQMSTQDYIEDQKRKYLYGP